MQATAYLGAMSTLENQAGLRLNPLKFSVGLLINVAGLAAIATTLVA